MLATILLVGCSGEKDVVLPSVGDSRFCKPFRAQRLNSEAGCLEDEIEFRCDNGGCNEVEVEAMDAEGNCYHMLGCAPPEWQNSLEHDLPKHCETLTAVPLCAALIDAALPDATLLDAGASDTELVSGQL